MCTLCSPYRPGHEDTTSTTEQDAARAERERAEDAGEFDDRPDPSEYL